MSSNFREKDAVVYDMYTNGARENRTVKTEWYNQFRIQFYKLKFKSFAYFPWYESEAPAK